ncbi:Fc.00g070860.m01.CDS01 [Cosmosporella sp. VM-42]
MAEVVGLVAAAGQFVEQSIKIIKFSKALYDKVQGAPEELQKWRQEIEEVQKLVTSIEDSPALRGSETTKASIDRCNSVSNELQAIFTELDFEETDALGRKTWKAIGGLAKESEIRRLFEEIERLKSTLNTQIGVANLNQGHEINIHLKELNSSHTFGTEHDQCLKDLFVTDPISDREGIITAKGQRTPGTCEWITTTKEYQAWDTSQSGLLWIYGPPGKGKTIISVYLTQLLEISQPEATTIYFFCDNKVASRNSAVNILRGLMYQLILRHEKLISHVLSPWKVQQQSLFKENSFENLWQVFQKMLESLAGHGLCCVLDALDECDETSLSYLLSKLKGLFKVENLRQKNLNLKLIVLSREHPQCIPSALSDFPHIPVDEVQHDIKLYISEQAACLANSKGIADTDLHHHIEKTFLERSEGTFLWVSFMSQDLDGKTIDQIEACLNQLPRGLYAVYERILSQLQPGNWKDVFDMLIWLTLAARPLTIGEICEATKIEPTHALSADQVCMGYIKSCGHLLQTSHNELKDLWFLHEDRHGHTGENNSPRNLEVNFVHQSAKDFLLERHKSLQARNYTVNSRQGHTDITIDLIQYLYNGCVQGEVNGETRKKYPLFDYAVFQWDYHMRRLGEDCSQVLRNNKDFFGKASKVRDDWYDKRMPPQRFPDFQLPVLHMASQFGLYSLAKLLLSKKSIFFGLAVRQKDIKRRWGPGATPLHRAVDGPHEPLIGLLLECGADPTIKNVFGQTALHSALEKQAYGAFDMILTTKRGRKLMEEEAARSATHPESLLHIAARNGDEKSCCDLIEKYHYNLELVDEHERTPLAAAMNCNQLDIARTLVERYGARTDAHFKLLEAVAAPDFFRSPKLQLSLQILAKEWNVDFSATDGNGNTALHSALLWPHGHIPSEKHYYMKCFLEFGCDPGRRNSAGQTCLYYQDLDILPPCPDYGSLVVLLQDGRLDINNRDQRGQTVLHSYVNWKDGMTLYLEELNEYLRSLLDLGADRHIRDARGKLALDIAFEEPRKVSMRHKFEKYLTQTVEEQKKYLEDRKRFLKETVETLENYSTVPVDPRVVPLKFGTASDKDS